MLWWSESRFPLNNNRRHVKLEASSLCTEVAYISEQKAVVHGISTDAATNRPFSSATVCKTSSTREQPYLKGRYMPWFANKRHTLFDFFCTG